MRGKARSDAALWAGAGGFCLFYLVPLLAFLVVASTSEGVGRVVDTAVDVLTASSTWRTVGFTTLQAGISALACVVFALPGAYLLSHYRFPLRRAVYSVTLIPFVLPSIIVVICIISFWGRSGVVNRVFGTDANLIYNGAGILIAHVFYNLSLAVRIVGDGWQTIDPRFREMAASMGDRRSGVFVRVTLPLLLPSLVSAFLLIFIYCFLSFGIVLVFGGIRFATLEVRIYESMTQRLDFVRAAVFVLLQLAFSAGLIAASSRLITGRQTPSRVAEAPLARLADEPVFKRGLLLLYAAVALMFLVGPLVALVARSIRPSGGLAFSAYRLLFASVQGGRDIEAVMRSSIGRVVVTSLGLCLASGTAAFVAALAAALRLRGRPSTWFDTLFQAPMGISAVSVCLALRLIFGRILGAIPLVIVAEIFVVFPFVFRILRTACNRLHPAYLESARSLGAGRVRVFRDITAPLLRRGLLNAYAYSLAIALADFTAVLIAGGGRIVTFPVAIFRLIGFRSFDAAMALAVVYVVLCLGLFIALDATSFAAPGAVAPGGGARGRRG